MVFLSLFVGFRWVEVGLNFGMPWFFFIPIIAGNLVWFVDSVTVSDLAFTFLLSTQLVCLGANGEASAAIIIKDHRGIFGFDLAWVWGFGWRNKWIALIKDPP